MDKWLVFTKGNVIMRFDGIDCVGEFKVDRVATLPTWSSAYKGRMVYVEDTDRLHIGTASAWRLVTKTTDDVDLTATAAEINTACDGITATAAELNIMDGVTTPFIQSLVARGSLNRPRFEWISSQNIGIGAGVYHHSGTAEQMVYWDIQLTKALTFFGSGWHYLYLWDSAIVSNDSPLLTASEFAWLDTEPVWNNSKGGFYFEDNRCIFAIWNGSSSGYAIREFNHNGDRFVEHDYRMRDLNSVTPPGLDHGSPWADLQLTLPKFGDGQQAPVTFHQSRVKDRRCSWIYARKNGSSGSGHLMIFPRGRYNAVPVNSSLITVDQNQKIEYIAQNYAGIHLNVYTDGYYLPRGM
jgi:hypothetical protein